MCATFVGRGEVTWEKHEYRLWKNIGIYGRPLIIIIIYLIKIKVSHSIQLLLLLFIIIVIYVWKGLLSSMCANGGAFL